LAVTVLAPWFLLDSYTRQKRPEIAKVLFLAIIGFGLFKIVLVIIGRIVAPRIRPMPLRPMVHVTPANFWEVMSNVFGLFLMFCANSSFSQQPSWVGPSYGFRRWKRRRSFAAVLPGCKFVDKRKAKTTFGREWASCSV
jgi:hypothetical protein